MAKYEKNKRFYWLQLKEDFFEEDAIDWLEEQPNGKEYSLFYLKLCLKSLRTNGILIRKVGQMLIPYDHNKLAKLTKTNSDTVLVAMKLLTKIGLVEILENGEIYLKQVEEMIGSQSIGAFKKTATKIDPKTATTKPKAIGRTKGRQVSTRYRDRERYRGRKKYRDKYRTRTS
ncbi:phage replisome organizer N-terminal domain-containing protein [Bacillus aquiflavi]|uniref:phage replisome organizer N-terminal domain-containing protein n=1 Tax=Bacillus aquiflavi TaxID=2672567 RepID=UPI001C552338|nr:phage replisome organizer N-terminal domain-containing protein [Bacillus aquiflavi]UAC48513.1 phage replisome organizer N-terminal domain-containing protein [Bacillus aquiflavi]